jgi:hypothetical protein
MVSSQPLIRCTPSHPRSRTPPDTLSLRLPERLSHHRGKGTIKTYLHSELLLSPLYTHLHTMANSHPSPQSATNYKEAFSLFDKRGNGRVSLDSLGDLLRACGQNPTLAEIRDLEKNVGGDCKTLSEHCQHHTNSKQSTSTPSAKSSTAQAASATQASQKNTAVVSRSLIRT